MSPSHLFNPAQVWQIYHSLHHLEASPEILPVVKEILLCSLEAADRFGKANPTGDGIHVIGRYAPQAFRYWVDESDARRSSKSITCVERMVGPSKVSRGIATVCGNHVRIQSQGWQEPTTCANESSKTFVSWTGLI